MGVEDDRISAVVAQVDAADVDHVAVARQLRGSGDDADLALAERLDAAHEKTLHGKSPWLTQSRRSKRGRSKFAMCVIL